MKKTEPPQKILFATDFSAYSSSARLWAIRMADLASVSVVVLHVVEFVDTTQDDHLRSWFGKLQEEASERLAAEVEIFRSRGVDAVGELAVGSPWELIARKGEEFEVDLIVVGSHGLRTREGRLLLGTTSHKVALSARPAVLIVKADSDESV